jgi:tRNA(Ile)-lysidine synthase
MAWTVLHSKLQQFFKRRSSLSRQTGRILVAVSGGQDSICLLQLLKDLQQQWQWELGVAHCDHGWSTDQGIADHVAKIAAGYELPYFQKNATDLPETEAAARIWRYQALTAIAEEQHFPLVMTGHTQTDRAETLLFNLFRGSGSDGLQAMGWERPLSPAVTLLRPLLDISRQQTGDFCRQQALPIWEDALNQKLDYRRNRIRHELIPYLQQQFNPQVETNLAQTVAIITAEVEYLDHLSCTLYQQVLSLDGDRLDRITLQTQPLALQRRVIRLFLQSFQRHAPNFDQIEAVVALIPAPNRAQSSTLPGQWVVRVEGNFLCRHSLKP